MHSAGCGKCPSLSNHNNSTVRTNAPQGPGSTRSKSSRRLGDASQYTVQAVDIKHLSVGTQISQSTTIAQPARTIDGRAHTLLHPCKPDTLGPRLVLAYLLPLLQCHVPLAACLSELLPQAAQVVAALQQLPAEQLHLGLELVILTLPAVTPDLRLLAQPIQLLQSEGSCGEIQRFAG